MFVISVFCCVTKKILSNVTYERESSFHFRSQKKRRKRVGCDGEAAGVEAGAECSELTSGTPKLRVNTENGSSL